MKLQAEAMCDLCEMETFRINGVDAKSFDFGDKYDEEPTDDYDCGDMQFHRKEPTQQVLEKYSITETEYDKIAEILKRLLSFGSCHLCQ